MKPQRTRELSRFTKSSTSLIFALDAVKIGMEQKLAMADSLILATAPDSPR